MNDKSDLPPGWAMPDDIAKKVSEALSRKSSKPEDELADALEDMAHDIALIEPNPVDWGAVCRDSCHLHPAVMRTALSKPVSSEAGFFDPTKGGEQNDESPHP